MQPETLSNKRPAPTGVVPSDVFGGKRLTLCKSLVKTVATIRDGRDHSDKANRCIVKDGECVGYYAVLTDYNESSDTFCVGWKQRVPSAQVDEVALYDALSKLIELINNWRTHCRRTIEVFAKNKLSVVRKANEI